VSLRSAALLALVGAILAIPVSRLVTSFIFAFAGVGTVVFLYVFHKAQP
jgi:hypothetical protein